MRNAIQAAPYPLSIFTTARPGAQLVSIAFRAVRPFSAVPYPVDVGSPMIKDPTSPPITLGSAASMPAAIIITGNVLIKSILSNKRQIPATPTSVTYAEFSP